MNNFSEKVNFIWSVADLLRGPYRPNQYKDIMLPLTVILEITGYKWSLVIGHWSLGKKRG